MRLLFGVAACLLASTSYAHTVGLAHGTSAGREERNHFKQIVDHNKHLKELFHRYDLQASHSTSSKDPDASSNSPSDPTHKRPEFQDQGFGPRHATQAAPRPHVDVDRGHGSLISTVAATQSRAGVHMLQNGSSGGNGMENGTANPEITSDEESANGTSTKVDPDLVDAPSDMSDASTTSPSVLDSDPWSSSLERANGTNITSEVFDPEIETVGNVTGNGTNDTNITGVFDPEAMRDMIDRFRDAFSESTAAASLWPANLSTPEPLEAGTPIHPNQTGIRVMNGTLGPGNHYTPFTHERLSDLVITPDIYKDVDKRFPTPPTVDMNVMTWNLFVRDLDQYVDAQIPRMSRLADTLFASIPEHKLDVLVLEDVYDARIAEAIIASFAVRGTGWRYFSEVDANAGVLVLSRWPIDPIKKNVTSFLPFGPCPTAFQFYADGSGVTYAKVTKTENGRAKRFHIFATRLSRTRPVDSSLNAALERQCQAERVLDHVQKMKLPLNEPVIIAGDLSIDAFGKTNPAELSDENELQAWAKIAHVDVPVLGGPVFTTYSAADHIYLNGRDGSAHTFGCGSDCEMMGKCDCVPPMWTDYVMLGLDNQQPIHKSAMYSIMVRTIPYVATMSYDAVADPDVIVQRDLTVLSNHDPVVRLLTFLH